MTGWREPSQKKQKQRRIEDVAEDDDSATIVISGIPNPQDRSTDDSYANEHAWDGTPDANADDDDDDDDDAGDRSSDDDRGGEGNGQLTTASDSATLPSEDEIRGGGYVFIGLFVVNIF